MEKLNKLIAALIITAFMACQKDSTVSLSPRAVNLTDTLTIKMSETVFSGNFSIKLDSIQDSRCPSDVNCFAAGFVVAKLIVQESNNSQIVRLQTDEKLDTATVFNRHLRLLEVTPYPISTHKILKSNYEIKLLVQ